MPQTLTIGSNGQDVILLQTRLNALPSELPPLLVDGDFGPVTLERVNEFQTNSNIAVTGIVDDETWAKLLGDVPIQRETFYTEGRQLFDPAGNKVLLRGINKMSVWDANDPTGAIYFPEIRKTQANTVRIVWLIKNNGVNTDLNLLDTLITNARKNQLIPMIELHDATCIWDGLQGLVDYWVQPDVVTLIQKHQAYLLVNIGNEVGNYKVTPEQFMAGYTDAVNRMRTAGIHVPLVIDASDCGKNLDILNASAGMMIAADPDKNLLLSVHLYWAIFDGRDAAFIQAKLQAAVALNYPLIIGEFSQYGAYTEDENHHAQNICSAFGETDYQAILNVAEQNEIGWYAWEWGPGNVGEGENFNPLCVVMDMTPDGQFNNLKPGWATDVVNSIKAASEKPGYFTLQPL